MDGCFEGSRFQHLFNKSLYTGGAKWHICGRRPSLMSTIKCTPWERSANAMTPPRHPLGNVDYFRCNIRNDSIQFVFWFHCISRSTFQSRKWMHFLRLVIVCFRNEAKLISTPRFISAFFSLWENFKRYNRKCFLDFSGIVRFQRSKKTRALLLPQLKDESFLKNLLFNVKFPNATNETLRFHVYNSEEIILFTNQKISWNRNLVSYRKTFHPVYCISNDLKQIIIFNQKSLWNEFKRILFLSLI
jgi:hypothetical protein